MYKVKEAADVLGVTRVEIFEIMVSQRELFEPYTSKSNSITYISEEGLSLLRQMLKRDIPPADTSVDEAEAQAVPLMSNAVEINLEAITEAAKVNDWVTHSDSGIETEETDFNAETDTSESTAFEEDDFNEGHLKSDPLEEIEAADDLIGQWLKEIQVEDEAADQQDEMLRHMRTQVTQMRNKILSLDSEMKRKDDAIRHYHEIMKDDVRWLEDLERKVQLIVKHGLLEKSEADADPVEEDKNNRFKFFKK